jgi:hypothetical protein
MRPPSRFCSFLLSTLLGIFVLLCLLPRHARAVDQDAGDIEILRAFQERYYTSKGYCCDWRDTTLEGNNAPNFAWPNPNWPSEGDFTQAQLDTIIGRIFSYLSRYACQTNAATTYPWNVPLLYLTDDDVAGGTNWGFMQKKIVRINGSASVSLAGKRKMIVETLRRQRILATKLYSASGAYRSTNTVWSDSFPGAPANVVDAAAYLEGRPVTVSGGVGSLSWPNLAAPDSGKFKTSAIIRLYDLKVASHLADVPFTAVLLMPAKTYRTGCKALTSATLNRHWKRRGFSSLRIRGSSNMAAGVLMPGTSCKRVQWTAIYRSSAI